MTGWHADRLVGPTVAVLSVAFMLSASAAVMPPSGALVGTIPQPTASPVASLSPSPSVAPSWTDTPQVTPRLSEPPPALPPLPPVDPGPARTVACGNGVDNSGGLGLICEVTVVNAPGTVTVTVRECHGAAGAPTAACTVETTVLLGHVTEITACNGSANGGGATLRCSVAVTTVDGTAITVNQCNGSGGGITSGCVPYPATALGADVTQCNGSANGGTLVMLMCSASGTGGVSITQCNGSGNGGGALVICTMRGS